MVRAAAASNYRLSSGRRRAPRQLTRLQGQASAGRGTAPPVTLAEVSGLSAIPGDARVTRNAYHLFAVYDPQRFGGRDKAEFARPSGGGIPISSAIRDWRRAGHPPTRGLYRGPAGARTTTEARCPVAESVCERGLWLPQNVLLGSHADVEDVVRAALKVQRAWA